MSTRRIHIRAPGVKTGSRIGPLGPFRGTLGIQWVVGSIAVGLVIVLAATWFLFRPPGPPFQEIEGLGVDDVAPGTAREVLAGVFLGVTADGRAIAVAEPANCPLEVVEGGYLDCAEQRFGLDGAGPKGRSLAVLPIEVHRGVLYIDTSAAAP
ncbi:MAG: hypothetical protein ACRDKA_14550 [Actinomycetota bacterium]